MLEQKAIAGKGANRSSLFFTIGLLCAAGFALSIEGAGRYLIGAGSRSIDLTVKAEISPVGARGASAADRADAAVAWRYFQKNTDDETGLVNSVAGFPSATLWDQGSYVLALNAAEALQIINGDEFNQRVNNFLSSLERLPLFEGKLPNKAYNTRTLKMVDYENNEVVGGIGWSALDIGRVLSGLRVLERRHSSFGPRIRKLLSSWDLEAMVERGELRGAVRKSDKVVHTQEGRIGYEQYAARASALWGLDVIQAISADDTTRWESVSGISVPIDLRNSSIFKAITPTLSEPFLLQGLELGLDSESEKLAAAIFLAQEARAKNTGIATMVSEDNINAAPYFLYSSVFSNGQDWAVVTEKGETHNDKRTVSLKAVFGWHALYNRPYTEKLRYELADLVSDGGWYAGRYESSGKTNDVLTLNTNAVVLEAVHYIEFGPLWQIR